MRIDITHPSSSPPITPSVSRFPSRASIGSLLQKGNKTYSYTGNSWRTVGADPEVVTQNTTAITQNATALTQHSVEISGLNSNVSSLGTSVSAVAVQTQDLSGSVQGITDSVSSLNQTVGTVTIQANTNTQNITKINSPITLSLNLSSDQTISAPQTSSNIFNWNVVVGNPTNFSLGKVTIPTSGTGVFTINYGMYIQPDSTITRVYCSLLINDVEKSIIEPPVTTGSVSQSATRTFALVAGDKVSMTVTLTGTGNCIFKSSGTFLSLQMTGITAS